MKFINQFVFQKPFKNTGKFGRFGWPNDVITKQIASSVRFSCNHVGYYGNRNPPPPVRVDWKKDKKFIEFKPGKVYFSITYFYSKKVSK